jgi:hypothetical protein
MEGEQFDAGIVDLHIEGIDLVIALDHGGREIRVPLDQCPEGLLDLMLHQRAHPEQHILQLSEFLIEMALHRGLLDAYPNRPVM